MNAVIIIPARYESSRFPGKPLYDIGEKSLIERVFVQCMMAVGASNVYVATDDERIESHCKERKMQTVMTSKDCLTGTDRVAEAYEKIGIEYDIIINVQGDEPLISPQDILKVACGLDCCNDPIIYCGMCPIEDEYEWVKPNVIKVVADKYNYLLYASRSPIPRNKNMGFSMAYKQVCIYAFSSRSLQKFKSDIKTPLESIEDIELLRYLEIGELVRMVEVSTDSIGVDTKDDAAYVARLIREKEDGDS